MDKYKWLISRLNRLISNIETKTNSYQKGKLKAYKEILQLINSGLV